MLTHTVTIEGEVFKTDADTAATLVKLADAARVTGDWRVFKAYLKDALTLRKAQHAHYSHALGRHITIGEAIQFSLLGVPATTVEIKKD